MMGRKKGKKSLNLFARKVGNVHKQHPSQRQQNNILVKVW